MSRRFQTRTVGDQTRTAGAIKGGLRGVAHIFLSRSVAKAEENVRSRPVSMHFPAMKTTNNSAPAMPLRSCVISCAVSERSRFRATRRPPNSAWVAPAFTNSTVPISQPAPNLAPIVGALSLRVATSAHLWPILSPLPCASFSLPFRLVLTALQLRRFSAVMASLFIARRCADGLCVRVWRPSVLARSLAAQSAAGKSNTSANSGNTMLRRTAGSQTRSASLPSSDSSMITAV